MKTVSLSGSPRENVGKKDASHLRADGKVPCVLYGGDDQKHFSIDRIQFDKFVYTPDVFIYELEIGGEKINAIVRDVQFHPVTDETLHVDFFQLIDGKTVKMELPLKLTGNAIGVRNGGRLMSNFRRIKIKGIPAELPDAVEVDITKLRIGHFIRIEDLKLPSATIMHNPKSVVVGVKMARGAVDEDEEGEEGEEDSEGESAAEAPAEG
ncbi:MAG: 50S ribosomal protein L25/general stress protein Ctc [Flavobacteriales bacterium]|nr:50S ribosomal protein L25/general stress protein Ctc [Flavobacteriales bacterium]